MVCLCLLRGQDDDLSLKDGVGVHKTVGVALEDGLVLHQIPKLFIQNGME